MAKHMRNHDMKFFGKDVSSTYSRNVLLATTVNGATDPSATSDMNKTRDNMVTTNAGRSLLVPCLSSASTHFAILHNLNEAGVD